MSSAAPERYVVSGARPKRTSKRVRGQGRSGVSAEPSHDVRVQRAGPSFLSEPADANR